MVQQEFIILHFWRPEAQNGWWDQGAGKTGFLLEAVGTINALVFSSF